MDRLGFTGQGSESLAGFLSEEDLQKFLTNEGEPFNTDEFDEMMTAAKDLDKGVVYYDEHAPQMVRYLATLYALATLYYLATLYLPCNLDKGAVYDEQMVRLGLAAAPYLHGLNI